MKGKWHASYGTTNLENLQELRKYISTQIPISHDVVNYLTEARGSGRTGLQPFIVVIPKKSLGNQTSSKDFLELQAVVNLKLTGIRFKQDNDGFLLKDSLSAENGAL